jgi:hypothetical protein
LLLEEIMQGNIDNRSQLQSASTALLSKIRKDCSDAIAAAKTNHIIYKGMTLNDTGEIWLTNPALRERKSRNTKNYYTLMFDNLPSWRDYPKRSRSLICSSNKRVAGNYGDIYVILPFNGAKIAVCPANDIWDSINSLGIAGLDCFNLALIIARISDTDWPTMLATLEKRCSKIKWPLTWKGKEITKLSRCRTQAGIKAFLNKFFNPQKIYL